MLEKDEPYSASRHEKIVAEARLYREQREKSYREKTLKMYPWVCGRCAREFTRANLRELTVHHRDHDHDNNPEDGSNWELLCIYCHDNEHSRYVDQVRSGGATILQREPEATFKPFAGLKDLFKK
ncbi:MAG: YajD family HNH nuclease [Methylococcales bacterium]